MTSSEIRRIYLEFFKSKGHQIVPSAPIVLKDDPTLMFSNSGMTQFKDFFLGYQTPSHLRVVDTQKCLRVSGKHNDLDDVGRDTYHHTMFEMLGNWSFGDYFKKEAIAWAWELLTEVYKIPKENLYVSIFEGDEKEQIAADQEAYDYWKSYVAEDRIINGNKKDNFWEMGETGPCGPCSEIHVDLRTDEEKAKVSGRDLVNQDHPQVVEIWNLVFMEFLRKDDGSLVKLPKQNVDTGMGFERLCMALQGKTSNYDTDVFTPLIAEVERNSGIQYTGDLTKQSDIAIRVIVDHIRAVSFAIADGQLPSNGGAGYVIRRILRRAVSYAYRFLNQKEASIYKLVSVLKNQMGEFFPEFSLQERLVTEVIKEEEQSFLKTIDQGLVRLDDLMQLAIANKQSVLAGDKVFELYDTYGFPADLSRIIAEEKNLSIDEKAFNQEMEKQKERSKKSSASKTYDWDVLADTQETFVGYDLLENRVKITRVRKVEQNDAVLYHLVLDASPFYAESGGQVGDKGVLVSDCESIDILDTKKENNLIIHVCAKLPKDLKTEFIAKVDAQKRALSQCHHSATHLLHEALRTVLGTHVEQKGSYVSSDYLRFDFSHFTKMTPEELSLVEQKVNAKISEGIALQDYRSLPISEALEKGAMALFGEKYGDKVRMIQFGSSKELCGGTHVRNTSEIALFKLMSESSTAAGIRRIEAITSQVAKDYFKTLEQDLKQVSEILKNKDIVKTAKKLQEENQSLKAQLEVLKKEISRNETQVWNKQWVQKTDKKVLIKKTSLDATTVKEILMKLRTEPQSLVVVLSDYGGKPTISVAVSDDLIQDYQAGQLVKNLARHIQGGGGGQPNFATAGGKLLEGIEKAYQEASEL